MDKFSRFIVHLYLPTEIRALPIANPEVPDGENSLSPVGNWTNNETTAAF